MFKIHIENKLSLPLRCPDQTFHKSSLGGSKFGRHKQSEFIARILKAHNDDRKLVNSPEIGQLADCAYVAACFQQTGFAGNGSSHSYIVGLRKCKSYTCGGVNTSNT